MEIEMSLYKPPRSKFYWYSLVIGGRRVRKSTKQTTKYLAELVANDAFTEARARGIEALTRKAPTLKDFSLEFLKYVEENQQLAKDTKRCYANGWRLLSNTPLASMKMDEIENHHVERVEFPGSASNANQAIRTLRKMFSTAGEMKRTFRTPKIKTRKGEKKRRFIPTAIQEAAVMGQMNQEAADVALILRGTGMRPKNVMEMRWENVRFDTAEYDNPQAKTDAGCGPKPLLEDSLAVLQRRHLEQGNPTTGWVFPSPKSPSGHRTTITKQFEKARKAAGAPVQMVPYSLRHKAATALYSATGNLKTVMDVIGHNDVATAMKYQHPSAEKLREQLEAAKTDGRIN